MATASRLSLEYPRRVNKVVFFNEVAGVFPFSIDNRDPERMYMRLDCVININAPAMDVSKMIADRVAIDDIPTIIGGYGEYRKRTNLHDLVFAGIDSTVRIRKVVSTDRQENFISGGVLYLYIPPSANPSVNTVVYHSDRSRTEHPTIKTFTFDVGDADAVAMHDDPFVPKETTRITVLANYCTGTLSGSESISLNTIIAKLERTAKDSGIHLSDTERNALPKIARILLSANGIAEDIDNAVRDHGNRVADSYKENDK